MKMIHVFLCNFLGSRRPISDAQKMSLYKELFAAGETDLEAYAVLACLLAQDDVKTQTQFQRENLIDAETPEQIRVAPKKIKKIFIV